MKSGSLPPKSVQIFNFLGFLTFGSNCFLAVYRFASENILFSVPCCLTMDSQTPNNFKFVHPQRFSLNKYLSCIFCVLKIHYICMEDKMKNLLLLILLSTLFISCGEDSVNNGSDVLLGSMDSLYVENDTVSGEIHLNRLTQSVKIVFDVETNAQSSNNPAIKIKFGIAEQTINVMSANNTIILNNSMLDSDVFFTVSVNGALVFVKLKNIKIYLI